MLVGFWPPDLCPIPDLYAEFPDFYANFILRLSLCQRVWVPVNFLWSFYKYSTHVMHDWRGGVGSCRWQKHLRGCECIIILARSLLRQAEARSWVSFRYLVPQGTGEKSSIDNESFWPCNRGCDLSVDPSMYEIQPEWLKSKKLLDSTCYIHDV